MGSNHEVKPTRYLRVGPGGVVKNRSSILSIYTERAEQHLGSEIEGDSVYGLIGTFKRFSEPAPTTAQWTAVCAKARELKAELAKEPKS